MNMNNKKVVDLRSDTVTRPTQQMLEAMTSAELGDDVLEGDPTVCKLQDLAAEMIGKEAALFVPSGTMANQIALATHTNPSEVVILEENSHLIYYEGGAGSVFSGTTTRTIQSENGVMEPDEIEKRITARSVHTPKTSLLWIENTHNRAGGTIIPLDYLKKYRQVADQNNLAIHLDGARVFNAAVALNVDVKEITRYADSVSFCLSKGLGSPVGSLICGSKSFVDGALFWRKRMGGGMRQSGILAACGIVSLKHHVQKLADDHRRAKRMAEFLASLPGLSVNMESVQTNIIMVHTEKPAHWWASQLEALSVWFFDLDPHRFRIVFHSDVNDEDLEYAISAFKQVSSTI
jgi:threonine aldolase